MLVTPKQEIISHAQQDVRVGFQNESFEKLCEALLHLGTVLGEQLLELVDDQHGPA